MQRVYGCLHTRSNVARLYPPRKEGRRGLIGIEECVRRKSKSLHGYLREITEWMLQAELEENVIVEEESLQDYERRRKDEKALHGAFVQQISDEAGEESWRWLRNGFSKNETEGLILAAQEQALQLISPYFGRVGLQVSWELGYYIPYFPLPLSKSQPNCVLGIGKFDLKFDLKLRF